MTTPLNLLDQFALFNTQLVKLHAELHRSINADDATQAHVEIKLTPGHLSKPIPGANAFQVGMTLSCRGVLKDEPDEKVFSLECTLNAGYQQISGDPVSFELFSTAHASLTRQLYPLIHQQLKPILGQLGLHNVNLPQDIIHSPGKQEEIPHQVH
jgi:hypothetical protein